MPFESNPDKIAESTTHGLAIGNKYYSVGERIEFAKLDGYKAGVVARLWEDQDVAFVELVDGRIFSYDDTWHVWPPENRATDHHEAA